MINLLRGWVDFDFKIEKWIHPGSEHLLLLILIVHLVADIIDGFFCDGMFFI